MTTHKPTYGFTTYRTAPQSKELVQFEEDLTDLVSDKIVFTNFRCEFQKKLQEDVKRINNNKNLLINADKTSSIYEVSKDKYSQLLKNNIRLAFHIYWEFDNSPLSPKNPQPSTKE